MFGVNSKHFAQGIEGRGILPFYKNENSDPNKLWRMSASELHICMLLHESNPLLDSALRFRSQTFGWLAEMAGRENTSFSLEISWYSFAFKIIFYTSLLFKIYYTLYYIQRLFKLKVMKFSFSRVWGNFDLGSYLEGRQLVNY